MTKNFSKGCRRLAVAVPIVLAVAAVGQNAQIGREVAIPSHLADGEEFSISLPQLIQFGQQLFNAKFTVQEGAGRPRSKGTGALISDSSSPLGGTGRFCPQVIKDRPQEGHQECSLFTAIATGRQGFSILRVVFSRCQFPLIARQYVSPCLDPFQVVERRYA